MLHDSGLAEDTRKKAELGIGSGAFRIATLRFDVLTKDFAIRSRTYQGVVVLCMGSRL